MHNYIHQRLPFSFNETWLFNHMRNPERELRNANDLFVAAHHFATVKRFPPPLLSREFGTKKKTRENGTRRYLLIVTS
jgi:hypothetical protein